MISVKTMSQMGWLVSRSAAEVEALYRASPHRAALDSVGTYCMFLGHARSGHSIVGSLLDAHPNIVIAHELHALALIGSGYTREQLFFRLLENSEAFTQAGRSWNGYDYAVPGQWNGRYRELRVIGDKKGGGSSVLLRERGDLLDRLRAIVGIPVKLVHVTRNPFDNIATLSHHQGLDSAIDRYFNIASTIAAVKKSIPAGDLHHLAHEALIQDPRSSMKSLCAFLGETAPADYLESCARIVYTSPHRRRADLAWTAAQRQLVTERLRSFPFLEHYTFTD